MVCTWCTRTIDVDNLRQLINQKIDNFEYANGNDATNTVKP